MKEYRQLSLSERKTIERALDEGKSFREISRLLARNVSTVSREVKTNRYLRTTQRKRSLCRDRNWCKRVGLCQSCFYPGGYCTSCDKIDCRQVCQHYETHTRCLILTQAPWVCNGCRKRRSVCTRSHRLVYLADLADKSVRTRRSESRRGINTTGLDMDFIETTLRDALKRNLSPYEIATLYADVCKVSVSTLYRWVEAGVGDTCNLDLERKVGFKPRQGQRKSRSTRHTKKRNHDAFLSLPQQRKASCLEMDTVVGFRHNLQVLLTLYHRPSHLQIALLLTQQRCVEVIGALRWLKSVCDTSLFESMFATVLTDNGCEFEDEDGLEYVLSGQSQKVHLYYCDPGQSAQKGACEKAHTELRQILPKGRMDFDELDAYDIAVVNSHVNSTPRLSLCGMSPIDMFQAAYRDAGVGLLEALGIERITRNELMLSPQILNRERTKRGVDPLTTY